MRQTVRSLGWATAILWIILLLFTITAVYSAFQIRPRLGQPSAANSGGTLTFSLPLSLYNGGFYDISKFNITTQVSDSRGSVLSRSSTYVPVVPKGENTTITHRISLSIEQASSADLSYLLFNDSELGIWATAKLTYASVVPLELSSNFTMPWGAPLANLVLGHVTAVSLNLTHVRAYVPFGFENHSFLKMNGTARLEIFDTADHIVGTSTVGFDAPPDTRFDTDVEVILAGNPANIREARLYLQTPFFNCGPVVFPLV